MNQDNLHDSKHPLSPRLTKYGDPNRITNVRITEEESRPQQGLYEQGSVSQQQEEFPQQGLSERQERSQQGLTGQQDLSQQGVSDLGRSQQGVSDLGRSDLGRSDLGRSDLGRQDLSQQDAGLRDQDKASKSLLDKIPPAGAIGDKIKEAGYNAKAKYHDYMASKKSQVDPSEVQAQKDFHRSKADAAPGYGERILEKGKEKLHGMKGNWATTKDEFAESRSADHAREKAQQYNQSAKIKSSAVRDAGGLNQTRTDVVGQ